MSSLLMPTDVASSLNLLIEQDSEALRCLLTPAELLEYHRLKCQDSFWYFIQHFWDDVPGCEPLIPNWHMQVIADELQTAAERVFRGEPRAYDLIFNVPFGTSKSTICSILFQPWTWTRMPQARHMTATHTEHLGMTLASKSRAVCTSDRYRELFPEIELRHDQDAKSFFANTLGGERQIFTVAGKNPMGHHFHFLGLDDPLDPQKAVSEVELERAKNFVNITVSTRKVNKATSLTVVVMQRLHERDPTHVMQEAAKLPGAVPVRTVCIPGELTDDVDPPELRKHYGPDGVMDRTRLPRAVLLEYQAKLGDYGYAGQVLQNPKARKGGMFSRESFYANAWVRAAPRDCRRVRYWDRAATQDGGCFTAGVLLAVDKEGRYYVEHVVKGQWEPDKRNAIMVATARQDRLKYGENQHEPIHIVEAERGSTGMESFRYLMRKYSQEVPGFRLVEDQPPQTGKDVRAEPWADMVASKNVWIVDDGTWDIEGYIDEHVLFKPDVTATKRLGKFKDVVDSSSGGFNRLTARGPLQATAIIIGRVAKGTKRLIVASFDQLGSLHVEEPVVWAVISDPSGRAEPKHGLQKVAERVDVAFANIDPADHQATWAEPIEPWGKRCDQVIFLPEHGRKIWGALYRPRGEQVQTWVIAAQELDVALSLALGVADGSGLDRAAVWVPEWGERLVSKDTAAPVGYIYDVMRRSRP
jgi:phage terminase large subunit-like protein